MHTLQYYLTTFILLYCFCFIQGECINTAGSYKCICPEDYTGQNCGTKINFCNKGPCKNGGKCLDGVLDFTCNCTDTGYTGATCEQNIDECADNSSNPCGLNGTCVDYPGNYSCTCDTGFTGLSRYSINVSFAVDSPSALITRPCHT